MASGEHGDSVHRHHSRWRDGSAFITGNGACDPPSCDQGLCSLRRCIPSSCGQRVAAAVVIGKRSIGGAQAGAGRFAYAVQRGTCCAAVPADHIATGQHTRAVAAQAGRHRCQRPVATLAGDCRGRRTPRSCSARGGGEQQQRRLHRPQRRLMRRAWRLSIGITRLLLGPAPLWPASSSYALQTKCSTRRRCWLGGGGCTAFGGC